MVEPVEYTTLPGDGLEQVAHDGMALRTRKIWAGIGGDETVGIGDAEKSAGECQSHERKSPGIQGVEQGHPGVTTGLTCE